MSYLLDFPTSQLPYNIRSPPYVVFAIQGKAIVDELPPRIPLNVVLHFAPKLKQWVLPLPATSSLPRPVAHLTLRTPYIGIDILSDDIGAPGLEWIVCKMLQASGLAHPKSLFLIDPTILTSTSIYQAWVTLDLPIAGIQNLLTHIHTRLMLGPAVTLLEMMAIWNVFPHTSEIVRAMGLNFIRSHINIQYTHREFSVIRDWYLRTAERCLFFKSLADQFPQFGEVQDKVLRAAAEKFAKGSAKKVASGKDTVGKVKKLMEKTGTRKVSPEEKKGRQVKDGAAMRSRLRRTKSDESIRSVETVIWDPPTEIQKGKAAKESVRAKEEPLLTERALFRRDTYTTLRRKSGKEELKAERKREKLGRQRSKKTNMMKRDDDDRNL